jgi:hypothetical protein
LRTVLKVALGILLAFVLLIGGCMLLIGGAANEAGKSIERDQNENAITNSQARSIKTGMTKSEVIDQLGPPKDTQESETEGLGKDQCLYWNVKGGEALDSWQFCFRGGGSSAKLESKNRM